MIVVLSERADRELDWIGARLESEHHGYGARFAQDFNVVVESMGMLPELHPLTEDVPVNRRYREYFIK